MHLKETEYEHMDWICLDLDRILWQNVVSKVMHLQVP